MGFNPTEVAVGATMSAFRTTYHVNGCDAPAWSTHEVVKLTGVTYRQIDHWERSGYVQVARPARGSGTRRALSIADIRVLMATSDLTHLMGGNVKNAAEVAETYRDCCGGALIDFNIPDTGMRANATVWVMTDLEVQAMMDSKVVR